MLYSLTMSRTSLYVTNRGKPGLWVSLLSSCALNCPFTVVMQDYKAYVNQEHVIRGNDVLFKCDVPSFVADFVSVQSWADNEGVVHATHSQGNREICIRQLDIRSALDLRLSFFYWSYSSSLDSWIGAIFLSQLSTSTTKLTFSKRPWFVAMTLFWSVRYRVSSLISSLWTAGSTLGEMTFDLMMLSSGIKN